MKKTVLGVKIDDVGLEDATGIAGKWLKGKGKHYIVTPNPEFLMAAREDSIFKEILNEADLAIPDGVGLRIGTDIVSNTPGTDLMEELIKLAAEKGFTVGFLGGRDMVAEKTAECLKKKYPKLKVSFVNEGGNWNIENGILKMKDGKLNQKKPTIVKTDILFIAFGHPKQEYWIAQNLDKIPVKVAMGVGGALDYLSGKVPRAPKWVRGLGLEWLFRLAIQPWRIKRQLALLKFVWLVIFSNN